MKLQFTHTRTLRKRLPVSIMLILRIKEINFISITMKYETKNISQTAEIYFATCHKGKSVGQQPIIKS